MRYWIYAEPASANSSTPVYTIMSDEAIIESYWDYWCGKMKSNGMGIRIEQKARCIDDWVTIHWAWEATPENLLRLIQDENA